MVRYCRNLQFLQSRDIFLTPSSIDTIKAKIDGSTIDLHWEAGARMVTWHIIKSRRHPFNKITVEQLRKSELRVQENNLDTIIALAQRSFGAAYQFVPPMSVTLGMKECLSAKKIRLYSDTGSWKQTALRVAFFQKKLLNTR